MNKIINKVKADLAGSLGCAVNRRVCVGLSGGVDSAVTAAVLKDLGYEVFALFMKNWDEGENCPAQQDFADVISVCEQLAIPYYSVNFTKEYQQRVFNNFIDQYNKGLTPNPDILCNSEIKFDAFYNYAKSLGADFIATGHYCRVVGGEDGFYLAKGVDINKDQSYFLHKIESKVLAEVIFPLGSLEKSEVRELARSYQLSVQAKKDSTGICFIGERKFREFLSKYITNSKGYFVDLDGCKLEEHPGACYFTPGQRKGLGLGGPGEPWYVVDKNMKTNEVIVARGHDHPAFFTNELHVDEIHWLSEPKDLSKLRCKIRYRQTDQDVDIQLTKNNIYAFKFKTPQRGVALGQYAVVYQDDICLGGGQITWKAPSLWSIKTKPSDSTASASSL